MGLRHFRIGFLVTFYSQQISVHFAVISLVGSAFLLATTLVYVFLVFLYIYIYIIFFLSLDFVSL